MAAADWKLLAALVVPFVYRTIVIINHKQMFFGLAYNCSLMVLSINLYQS